MSFSPGSDNSLRFLSHCKNGSPLSIISMPRASVVNRHAQRRFNDSTNDYFPEYPSKHSTGSDSEWILCCQRKVRYKLHVCRQCCRNFPLSFLEKCRPFTGEQEFWGRGNDGSCKFVYKGLFVSCDTFRIHFGCFQANIIICTFKEFLFCYAVCKHYTTHICRKKNLLFYPMPRPWNPCGDQSLSATFKAHFERVKITEDGQPVWPIGER